MEEFARHEFERARDEGAAVKRQRRFGYDGYLVKGFFHGRREGSSMIVSSGSVAANIYRSVAAVSDNVARLDVQVTVYTPNDRPDLAKQAYEVLRSSPPAAVRVRSCSLIVTHPQGGTCNVGKRISDQSGRIYDKAAESDLGTSRTVWRYEVELKRNLATAGVTRLISSDDSQADSRALVHRWFSDRGLDPVFTPRQFSSTDELAVGRAERDTMGWFRDTLARSVARQVKLHGLRAVEHALGLPVLHNLNCERRKDYGAACRCTLQS
jgi:hypothetical protein